MISNNNLEGTEIKNFLTQRALQTAIFQLADLGRDEITANWIEGWAGHEGIRRYHGLNGLKLHWRDYLSKLTAAPPETVVVEFKRRGAGVGGWSKDNPYLQNHVYEYKEEIVPQKLANKIMRLREEIASEWDEDLQLLSKENDEMWRSFFEKVREKGEDAQAHLQMPAFQHDFSDSNCGTNYRGGNYDLLKRMATRQAIQEVLAAGENKVECEVLDRIFAVHGAEFQGDAGYGVDMKFLEDLLGRSPSFVRDPASDEMALVSPLSIAEKIVGRRVEIANRWREGLRETVADHADILRTAFEFSFDSEHSQSE